MFFLYRGNILIASHSNLEQLIDAAKKFVTRDFVIKNSNNEIVFSSEAAKQ